MMKCILEIQSKNTGGKSLEELFENPEEKLQLLREGIAPLRNTLEQ